MLFPVAMGLALFAPRLASRAVTGAPAVIAFVVLILTGSRSALSASFVAMLVAVVLRWRRLRLVLPIIVVVIAAFVLWFQPERVFEWLLAMDSATGAKGRERMEIWGRAVQMIRDFPLTGIGLNTFPLVTTVLYPLFVHPRTPGHPHAHNIFLQVAVDLGILGLLSFLALLIAIAFALARYWRNAPNPDRGLVAGMAAGLMGHLFFGLTDAVALGAKPGVFLWLIFGCALGIRSQRTEPVCPLRPLEEPSGQRSRAGPENGLGVAHVVRAGTSFVHWLQWGLFTLACSLGVVIAVTGIEMFP